MTDRVIRPSMKLIKAGYVLAVLVIVAAVVVHVKYLMPREDPTWVHQPWLPAVAALVLLLPIRRHIRRQSVKMTITGDKLRYEAGLLSKTTRNIQLSKVQDVRVDQSLGHRMLGVGDISIETSGESSRLEMDNVDSPQAIADEIIAASQEHGSTQAGAGKPA
ncbi:MAG TPA: PH domain-containing protein [Bryobacteraceae bacterium]|nr:PH domain-containing protein [Bryobacteraceae bacterium]